jgi:hypothetical protein
VAEEGRGKVELSGGDEIASSAETLTKVRSHRSDAHPSGDADTFKFGVWVGVVLEPAMVTEETPWTVPLFAVMVTVAPVAV